jgi:predicted MFS family arabinose efflux permease
LIGWSFALYALILVLMIPTTSYEVAIMLMLGAGFGWIGVLSGLSGPVQFALTEGMRARGLASYLVVQFGCNALGAFIWGQVTQHSGLTTSYAVAAMLMTLGISLTLLRPIRDEELLAD